MLGPTKYPLSSAAKTGTIGEGGMNLRLKQTKRADHDAIFLQIQVFLSLDLHGFLFILHSGF